ncbi:MAG: fimbrial assembly protein, partial [Proteobacteria bacterium]
MKSARWIVTYIVAASVGLWFALFLSMKFVAPARAQQAPAAQAPQNGDLPPEFMQDAAIPTAPGQIPPAPTEPPPE